ncbi:MAG: hypothetical protein ACOC2M_02170 [bacterium]
MMVFFVCSNAYAEKYFDLSYYNSDKLSVDERRKYIQEFIPRAGCYNEHYNATDLINDYFAGNEPENTVIHLTRDGKDCKSVQLVNGKPIFKDYKMNMPMGDLYRAYQTAIQNGYDTEFLKTHFKPFDRPYYIYFFSLYNQNPPNEFAEDILKELGEDKVKTRSVVRNMYGHYKAVPDLPQQMIMGRLFIGMGGRVMTNVSIFEGNNICSPLYPVIAKEEAGTGAVARNGNCFGAIKDPENNYFIEGKYMLYEAGIEMATARFSRNHYNFFNNEIKSDFVFRGCEENFSENIFKEKRPQAYWTGMWLDKIN